MACIWERRNGWWGVAASARRKTVGKAGAVLGMLWPWEGQVVWEAGIEGTQDCQNACQEWCFRLLEALFLLSAPSLGEARSVDPGLPPSGLS